MPDFQVLYQNFTCYPQFYLPVLICRSAPMQHHCFQIGLCGVAEIELPWNLGFTDVWIIFHRQGVQCYFALIIMTGCCLNQTKCEERLRDMPWMSWVISQGPSLPFHNSVNFLKFVLEREQKLKK